MIPASLQNLLNQRYRCVAVELRPSARVEGPFRLSAGGTLITAPLRSVCLVTTAAVAVTLAFRVHHAAVEVTTSGGALDARGEGSRGLGCTRSWSWCPAGLTARLELDPIWLFERGEVFPMLELRNLSARPRSVVVQVDSLEILERPGR